MKVRIKDGVIRRRETFGGICYVPHRDDFFALDKPSFYLVATILSKWQPVPRRLNAAYSSLARLGMCETKDPVTREEHYSGPGFVGNFEDIPFLAQPLLVNCFATAHCPLKCLYCHADDLMVEFRKDESHASIEMVLQTVRQVPAMVAVITGGDPLTRPDRARRLIEGLASEKALVLDTSGVGDVDELLPIIRDHGVHVRVSLDAIDHVNDGLRPPNSVYGFTNRDSSRIGAQRTIEKCLQAGIPLTVQTVVNARNESIDGLRNLRDWLVGNGVKNWVLHLAIKAGMARKIQRRMEGKPRGGILPSPDARKAIQQLIDESVSQRLPLDIRCTDSNASPNSVLLVNTRGDLYTEGYARNGKSILYSVDGSEATDLMSAWGRIDHLGHAERYLNWNSWMWRGEGIENECYSVPMIPHLKMDTLDTRSIVKKELKFRVIKVSSLRTILHRLGFKEIDVTTVSEELYDTRDGLLRRTDNLVKIVRSNRKLRFRFRGPRILSSKGDYSWMSIEIEAGTETGVKRDLLACGLRCVWSLRRIETEFRKSGLDLSVVLLQFEKLGTYVELRGEPRFFREVKEMISESVEGPELRNYHELDSSRESP